MWNVKPYPRFLRKWAGIMGFPRWRKEQHKKRTIEWFPWIIWGISRCEGDSFTMVISLCGKALLLFLFQRMRTWKLPEIIIIREVFWGNFKERFQVAKKSFCDILRFQPIEKHASSFFILLPLIKSFLRSFRQSTAYFTSKNLLWSLWILM